MARLMHAVVPAGIDDPAHPSGGNAYDRRVLDALAGLGWCVTEHPAAGDWPRPCAADLAGLKRILGAVPDGTVLLADGLIASAAAGVLWPETSRLPLVTLVHTPLGTGEERDLLGRAAAVITTSPWTRDRLIEEGLPPERIAVAEPGTDPAPVAAPSPGGDRLLSVGVLAPHKGQDLLVAALGLLDDLRWSCTVVGALDVDPAFAGRVERAAARLADRVGFRGPLAGDQLAAAYAGADLLVLPSRVETFGMVIGEALTRGVPVVAADVGGVPAALGSDPSGCSPGVLVRPGDAAALAGALRSWLIEAGLRERLRASALRRRETLPGWSTTARRVSDVLLGVAA